jgi:hypothetical protein
MMTDRLTRIFQRLGLRRVAKDAMSLQQYLHQHDERKKASMNEEQP